MFIYSPQVAKADWMGDDKPVVEAFEELFIDSEGLSLVQHVRCVQLDENSGAVMKVLLMVSMDKRARLDAVIEGLCTGGSNTFEVFGRDTDVHCFRSESEARIGLEMESPSPTSGGRGGGGGGRGGGCGPVASLGARFEDIAVFNQRAGAAVEKNRATC